ncbi:hypothetical protein A1D23_04685 [Chelonobacter oris]|uniref:primosomal replication protein PriC n=1 Tax=Chelonobacter oris TaxID=505317 RepID=UPI00244C3052|nr:primosomal replication protein PriC [Chelonobacter oris]MDH2999400.1 hypothetical protein [Chelonobacter oris]
MSFSPVADQLFPIRIAKLKQAGNRRMQPHFDKIACYFQALAEYENKPITQPLDSRLFSIEHETVGQCLAQARQTLAILQHTGQETAQAAFYAEKLVAQYHALLDLTQSHSQKPHFAAKPAPIKNKHQVHDLPPKARLEKYYQFLRQLNDLVAQQNDALLQATPQHHSTLIQKIQQTEQRKQRCQDAIDNLEEYLFFVAEREKG